MKTHPSHFFTRRNGGSFTKLRVTSSHDIVSCSSPQCGDGSKTGSRSVEFSVPAAVPVVNGIAIVDAKSALGPIKTTPQWI